MFDQILTQEEIDALLSAMDKGDVDLHKRKKRQTEAVSYSLTTQNIILRDQFYALEEVYDKFVTLMNQMLSSTLQHYRSRIRIGGNGKVSRIYSGIFVSDQFSDIHDAAAYRFCTVGD